MSDKTFYVTTPIYYVNARPHIGHAYTTIVADVLARRHRLLGDDTFFLTGTDEHGQKIERSASAAGVPPQQFADQVSAQFRSLWERMGLTYSDYIRTTDPKHKIGAQQLFRTLYENGFIKLGTYTGAYCVSDEAFVEAPVGTPCPDCGRLLEEVTEENFFFELSKFQKPILELIESDALTITPDSARNEVLSFIRGIHTNVINEYVAEAAKEGIDLKSAYSKSEIRQTALVIGRLLGDVPLSSAGFPFAPDALRDLSISRSSFNWGIQVPDDIQQAADAKQKHVIYVWLDALSNYMTALGYGNEDTTLFDKFWPADLHLVGKEITRFHCVYWPAFLLALNPKLKHRAGEPVPVLTSAEQAEWIEKWIPKQITANGWLLFDNSKMSKSKGNVVRTETILDGFGEHVYAKQFPDSTKHERDLFASDVLRYFLLREIPFGQDGSFSFDALITRYNADLANGLGNLASRTLKMIDLYFGGIIPASTETSLQYGAAEIIPDAVEEELIASLDRREFSAFLDGIARIVAATDGMLTTNRPWKERDTELATSLNRQFCLSVAAAVVQRLAMLVYPVIPFAAGRIWSQLGLGNIEEAAARGDLRNLDWADGLDNTNVGTLAPIFPRADKGLAQIMTDMENPTPVDTNPTDPAAVPPPATTDPAAPPRTSSLHEPLAALPVGGSTALTTGPDPTHPAPTPAVIAAVEAAPVEVTPQITIDDFVKVELRVAAILVAERIPKADKLLRLEVDLGTEFPRRQILSGIAEWYAPEDLIGRRIIVITNLAPRKMRGLESHGMLLAASQEGGKPYLATVPEGVPVGTRLK